MSKVSEVMLLAARCLALDEVAEYYENAAAGESTPPASGGNMSFLREKSDLLRCVNLVAGDLAMGAVVLTKSKTVAVTGGSVMYSMIDKNLTEVVSVTTDGGKKIRFTPYSDRFLAEDGIYNVTYRYLPGVLEEDDDLPFPADVGVKAVAYGAACEYCLINGRNNDAVKWQALFEKQTERLEERKTRGAGVMPARGWS